MLLFFRTNTILNYVALFIFTALIRCTVFWLHPHAELSINAPLAQFIFTDSGIVHWSLLANYLVTSLLIFLQALWLNLITTRHNFLPSYSTIPGLLFVTINSMYPEQMILTPQLFSNFFILILFQRLCYLYEAPRPLYLALEAGFYLGLALLFNYNLIFYLFFIIVAVITMTSFNLRFITVSIIGLFLPLYFTTIFFYLANRLNDFTILVKDSFSGSLFHFGNIRFELLYPWIFIVLLVIISVLRIQNRLFSNSVKTRRILIMNTVLLFISLPVVFSEAKNSIFNLTYFSIPTAIVIAHYFSDSGRLRLKNILFLILFIISVGFSFFVK